MMIPPLRTGPWNLTDLKHVPQNNYKVFSTFHCGGGSTMGYKLAGFDVLGGVEIDPKMMAVYKANHSPRHSYLMGVGDFNKLNDIPKEVMELDILDGSPPCSSFSMAGSREKAWGKKKKFREGQADQILDDLFFQFIETARKLQPKVVIAENVKGLLHGKAKGYVKQISQMLNHAGYNTQLFLLNAAFMGVPQLRERTFFVASRKDLGLNKIDLKFNEETISVKNAFVGTIPNGKLLSSNPKRWWNKTKPGGLFSVCGASTGKMNRRLNEKKPSWTVTATPNVFHFNEPRHLSKTECSRIQTYPDDYNYLENNSNYLCGMSVPPFMMQRVANQVRIQWLDKL